MVATRIGRFALAILVVLLCQEPSRGAMIGLDGSIYTNESASSVYADLFTSYGPDKIFDAPAPVVGSASNLNVAWIGKGVGPHYLAFQLDQSYSFDELFYAQRLAYGNTVDEGKVGLIEIWAGDTPFSAINPPGTVPHAQADITNISSYTFDAYSLIFPVPVVGQYVLAKFTMAAGSRGNPGGTEFRLGGGIADVIIPEPTSLAIWSVLGGIGLVFLGRRRRKAAA